MTISIYALNLANADRPDAAFNLSFKPILDEYERQAAARRAVDRGDDGRGKPVDVTCEDCGKSSKFPFAQNGSVQRCPHCRAYVDVGDEIGFEGWDEEAGEEHEAG